MIDFNNRFNCFVKRVKSFLIILGWGARHTFSFLAFLSLLVNSALRVNISVAIVAMVKSGNFFKYCNNTNFKRQLYKSRKPKCPNHSNKNGSKNHKSLLKKFSPKNL